MPSSKTVAPTRSGVQVIFLQNGGWLEFFTATVWDTSWLVKEDSITGRLLHTLVGYSEAPNGAQLIAYGATILVILVLIALGVFK